MNTTSWCVKECRKRRLNRRASFLSKYVNVLTSTQDAQLGYALDSRYYNITDYSDYMREQLAKLTLEDVNRAIRKYLKSDAMRIVIVTKDAAGLRDAILSNKTSPITYNAAKPKEITDEDKSDRGLQDCGEAGGRDYRVGRLECFSKSAC